MIRRRSAVAAAALVVVALAGCASGGSPSGGGGSSSRVEHVEAAPYRSIDGQELLADACLPAEGEQADRPAMVLLHGGGFEEGGRDKGGMPRLCDEFAQRGIVAVSIDYRLLPAASYPAQVEDAAAAVAWLREPTQVERFGLDPARIGVLGSSAGAIIAQSLGTAGEGALDAGSRVRLVVSLSGASDLTPAALEKGEPSPEAQQTIQAYLGCLGEEYTACGSTDAASPQTQVDASDAPMLLMNGDRELVPVEQLEGMEQALRAAGVDVQTVVEPGAKHGTQLMTSSNVRTMLEFVQERL